MAEAASAVPQGSVLGSILFVIYANDLTVHLTIDHLLYDDDVKLIAPRKLLADNIMRHLPDSMYTASEWFLFAEMDYLIYMNA